MCINTIVHAEHAMQTIWPAHTHIPFLGGSGGLMEGVSHCLSGSSGCITDPFSALSSMNHALRSAASGVSSCSGASRSVTISLLPATRIPHASACSKSFCLALPLSLSLAIFRGQSDISGSAHLHNVAVYRLIARPLVVAHPHWRVRHLQHQQFRVSESESVAERTGRTKGRG